MARKKEEFDPLAGPIGGGGIRKKKSKEKTFDVLGGGFGGDHPVEKESFDSYSDVSFGGSSDALMETGGSSSSNAKPKKKGLFASIFGGGRKKKQKKSPAKSQPLEPETEKPESYVPKHLLDHELEIHDGVMETGIVDRMVDPAYDRRPASQGRYEDPVSDSLGGEVSEEDLFEGEETRQRPVQGLAEKKAAPAPVSADVTYASSSVMEDSHVCYLCGAEFSAALPPFELAPGKYVPVCRTCSHAVKTLKTFRDPSDEREIKLEWYTLCPNLDSDRADVIIAEARRDS